MKTTINNIQDLRNDLIDLYNRIGSDTSINLQTARVQSDVAGKIIKSAMVELSERIRTQNNKPISFLNE